jgi:hypothetical protein
MKLNADVGQRGVQEDQHCCRQLHGGSEQREGVEPAKKEELFLDLPSLESARSFNSAMRSSAGLRSTFPRGAPLPADLVDAILQVNL